MCFTVLLTKEGTTITEKNNLTEQKTSLVLLQNMGDMYKSVHNKGLIRNKAFWAVQGLWVWLTRCISINHNMAPLTICCHICSSFLQVLSIYQTHYCKFYVSDWYWRCRERISCRGAYVHQILPPTRLLTFIINCIAHTRCCVLATNLEGNRMQVQRVI